MRLTVFTDYALRAFMRLAGDPNGPFSWPLPRRPSCVRLMW
jgi:hypothetical protein